MASDIKVSLIVSFFEQGHILPSLLELLFRQSFTDPWELIICDDGSVTDCRQFLYSQTWPRHIDCRYIWQPDSGFRLAQSRNNGIRLSRGEILIFLDGDSLVDSDFILRHVKAHAGRNAVVCGSRELLFTEGKKISELPTDFKSLRNISRIRGHDYISWQEKTFATSPWEACMGCNVSIRAGRSIFYHEVFMGWGSEDVEFAYRLHMLHGLEIVLDIDCRVISIEEGSPALYSPVRPTSHKDIALCIYDVFTFYNMYKNEDIARLLRICKFFELDPNGQRWKRTSDSDLKTRSVEAAISVARRWFETQPISSRLSTACPTAPA